MIVVEVLSPGTRTEDTVRKSHEYAVAGLAHQWTVVRDNRSFTVLENTGDSWDIAMELDERRGTGHVVVGEHGCVEIDLGSFFAR
ncbi:hypothetical protein ncot_07055 [Nocardioides sp. JQ2195]|uniref:Uma2 family endonuclease n=1 Tax=Nocardioides sp. JQ2195 TaxID=2592334 RepID=UPI00143EECF0|nr:Uma2 family endonuclease [Nocardioides sp. JQ2195]QIX26385.1 hypothetical protein ncot_07055 [Nocardioides sp. JQ2195]